VTSSACRAVGEVFSSSRLDAGVAISVSQLGDCANDRPETPLSVNPTSLLQRRGAARRGSRDRIQ